MIFWVYILEITRNSKNTFYIGYSSDLSKRIQQHKSGKGAKYTMGDSIIKLVFTESFKLRSEAMKREIELKKLKRTEKIKLIENYTSLPSNFFK